MKNCVVVLGLLLLLGSLSFAATSYVITNNDNASANSSTIYTLNTSNGTLTSFKKLNTGGLGNSGGFFAEVSNAISRDAKCIYVYDGGSSDIAAFATSNLQKVGNYSNPSLNGNFPGGSLALTPNGAYLYATYAGTEIIGAWKRNSDCSLTFIAAYTAKSGADTYSNLIVDPTGKGLLVSVEDLGYIELFLINSNGTLKDVAAANLNNLPCNDPNIGCFPAGLDITKGEFLIAGNAILGGGAFTTQLTAKSPFFTKTAYVDLTNSAALCNSEVPWLSAAAYSTGTGPMYMGFSGFGAGCQPGVLTTTLSGGTLTLGKATPINSPNLYDGLIQNTGKWMVVSEWFNQLQVFQINNDGSLTATSQGPVTDNDANGALTFFIYPQTR